MSVDHGMSFIFWKLWPTAFRLRFAKCIFPMCTFVKWLTHLLSFGSLSILISDLQEGFPLPGWDETERGASRPTGRIWTKGEDGSHDHDPGERRGGARDRLPQACPCCRLPLLQGNVSCAGHPLQSSSSFSSSSSSSPSSRWWWWRKWVERWGCWGWKGRHLPQLSMPATQVSITFIATQVRIIFIAEDTSQNHLHCRHYHDCYHCHHCNHPQHRHHCQTVIQLFLNIETQNKCI